MRECRVSPATELTSQRPTTDRTLTFHNNLHHLCASHIAPKRLHRLRRPGTQTYPALQHSVFSLMSHVPVRPRHLVWTARSRPRWWRGAAVLLLGSRTADASDEKMTWSERHTTEVSFFALNGHTVRSQAKDTAEVPRLKTTFQSRESGVRRCA